ncbi:hypothetical protein ANCDUO_07317 [Ancylostoma duodenale]|uniref:Uncharacterized protein n=1 Tax=Ancylostoma duodenale TaxID=51022 RepID=A0A0C2CZD5_9BILA|nr:hypothetical protein ANCDUO_07317 [Ancylostoma duodenale]
MVEQLNDKNYVKNAPGPVKTLAWFYEQCVSARLDWVDAVQNGKVVMKAVQGLAAGIKQPSNIWFRPRRVQSSSGGMFSYR